MSFCDIAPVKNAIRLCTLASARGWHECNGGNISYMLSETEEAAASEYFNKQPRFVPLPSPLPLLANCAFLCTTSGSFLESAGIDPENTFCIIKINRSGDGYYLLFCKEARRPTSELPSHLNAFAVKFSLGQKIRTVYHCHPAHIIASSCLIKCSSKDFTRAMWRSISECAIVFPEGVGMLPWFPPASEQLASKTAELLIQFNIIVWVNHGVFATGDDFDNVFSLVDTVEKAAYIYLLTYDKPIKNMISDANLITLASVFGKELRRDFL